MRIKPRPYCAAELIVNRDAVAGAAWPGLCLTLGIKEPKDAKDEMGSSAQRGHT
jgi:hypothetical protein